MTCKTTFNALSPETANSVLEDRSSHMVYGRHEMIEILRITAIQRTGFYE